MVMPFYCAICGSWLVGYEFVTLGLWISDYALMSFSNMGHSWYMLTRTKIMVVLNEFKVKA